jgi:hypothetical protein
MRIIAAKAARPIAIKEEYSNINARLVIAC